MKAKERKAKALLRERYERRGYVRYKDAVAKGIKRTGWEVRLYAYDRTDLRRLVAALKRLAFRPGNAYAKAPGWIVPVYGRDQVERFLDMTRPARKADVPGPPRPAPDNRRAKLKRKRTGEM